MTHTEEPWKVKTDNPTLVLGGDNILVASAFGQVVEEERANARRIALCVNYCKGMTDAELEYPGYTYSDLAVRRMSAVPEGPTAVLDPQQVLERIARLPKLDEEYFMKHVEHVRVVAGTDVDRANFPLAKAGGYWTNFFDGGNEHGVVGEGSVSKDGDLFYELGQSIPVPRAGFLRTPEQLADAFCGLGLSAQGWYCPDLKLRGVKP